jgi:hypothetical protein
VAVDYEAINCALINVMKYVTYINMNDEVLKQNNFGLQKNKPTK